MATERAKPELTALFESIKQKAKEKQLPLFLGAPDDSHSAVQWNGSWTAFLDLAEQAQARVLYVEKVRFDVDDDESVIYSNWDQIHREKKRLARQNQMSVRPIDRMPGGVETLGDEWAEPILTKLTRWQTHQGEIVSLRCVWFKEGIAHQWQTTAKWLQEWQLDVHQKVQEAQVELREQRATLKKEDAFRLHECGRQMAQHERFPEAKNDSRREFMAQTLFPEESEETYRQIIELANLYYWWAVEPAQGAAKDERARTLHRSGESVTNIAAVLDMSPAKVKRALQSPSTTE